MQAEEAVTDGEEEAEITSVAFDPAQAQVLLLGIRGPANDSAAGTLFAALPLTIENLERLAAAFVNLWAAQQAFPEIARVETWHDPLHYFDAGKEMDGEEALDARLEALEESGVLEFTNQDWAIVPAVLVPPEDNIRTECNRMVLTLKILDSDQAEVYWRACLKHTDARLETNGIREPQIVAWLAALRAAKEAASG